MSNTETAAQQTYELPFDDAEIMKLWRECGLPEYFLGNGGTNHKLVEFVKRVQSPELLRERDELRERVKELQDDLRYRPPCPEFSPIQALGHELGYNVIEHGSFKRDYDLIAVPWTEEAVNPRALVAALCMKFEARVVGNYEEKPHGRLAVCLQRDKREKHWDLSVFAPSIDHPDIASLAAERDSLDADNERLQEALLPFTCPPGGKGYCTISCTPGWTEFANGHIDKARAALAGTEAGEE